jgi:isoquinoline 1-oxidoreductase beta subunit
MSGKGDTERRDLLKAGPTVGGDLMVGIRTESRASGAAGKGSDGTFTPNAFLRIDRDGVITFIANKSEMGQGVYTALPMLVAEELECDWRSIRLQPAPVDTAYNSAVRPVQSTGGSMSTWSEWDRLSRVGAVAREMLIAAAARIWNVDPGTCRAENGRVISDDGRSLPYGELVDEAGRMAVPADVVLKKPGAYRILERPMPRLDNPVKVNGTAKFGIDVMFPGMLTAVIERPPVFGGKVVSFNADKTGAVAGVREVIQVPSGVAVVAADFWSAQQGRRLLEVEWDLGKGAALSTEEIRSDYARLAETPGAVARNEGDAEGALAAASIRLDAEYDVPYLAHACMEPLNCFVDLRDDGCEIWVGTQAQTWDRDAAARITGLEPEQIRLHTTFLGGGFGRRGNPHSDFVSQAVEVAKAVRKPVKVVWSREDDMRAGFYRPLWYDRISAGLDGAGNLTAWKHTIVGQSILADTPYAAMMTGSEIDFTSVEGAHDIPYTIPNILVDLHSPTQPVTVQWWRSVGHSHTAFVVESFIDEAAHAAGKDPLEFRRALLAGKLRHLGVLELAAEKAGWGSALPSGRARGIAVHNSFGSFAAQVAEVSVSDDGKVRVHRVVCAVDCGRFVNPNIIAEQMESGIVFGLSAVLHGEITLKDGRVQQTNFRDYDVLRMREMPVVEVHIARTGESPGGIGEPGVPPIAPAVGNAIFALTGRRIRRLPIRPEDLTKAE